jgi:hypothetical protein
VFTETASGARSDRPTFERVLDHFDRAELYSVTNQEAFSSEHHKQGHARSAHTSGKRHRAGWGNLLDLPPCLPHLLFAYRQQPYTSS